MKFLKKNKKGFSLVELIVVIAILGVLAAIVVPRIAGQTEAARVAHDRATLRLVQGAVAMYHAQHGRFPVAATYAALNAPLFPFLDLGPTAPGTMPAARSGTPTRLFQYDPATGAVTIAPALP